MECDAIRAGIDKSGQVLIGILDHEVYVNRQVCQSTNGFNNGKSIGQVGDKNPIHHIQMQGLHTRLFERSDFAFQIPKVAHQERRENDPFFVP